VETFGHGEVSPSDLIFDPAGRNPPNGFDDGNRACHATHIMRASPTEPSRLAFTYVGFRFFWLTTLLVSFAVQIMSVSIA
jgi:hypothetical protein